MSLTPIKNVVVVGAGTSGWITASAIKRNNPTIAVTLVHDSTIPTMGVGETLTFGMPHFMREVLGLKDEDWMGPCQATYKNGVKWTDWKNKGDFHQSAFVTDFAVRDLIDNHYIVARQTHVKKNIPGLTDPNMLITKLWYSMYRKGMLGDSVDDLQAALTEQYYFSLNNKSIRNLDGSWISNQYHGHTYHYNAEVVSNVVGNLVGKPHGVVEIDSRVTDVKLDNQSIKSLKLANGVELTADLFIDCTGFKKLLMSQMPNEWVDSDEYSNNSALVKQVTYDDSGHPQHQVSNSTVFAAMSSGWRFSVPLQHRSGNGYIFNKNITPDIDQLAGEFNTSIADNSRCRLIQWSPGRYANAVVNNCMSLGLSLGFTDPFDANNLTVTTTLIKAIAKILSNPEDNNLSSLTSIVNGINNILWEDVDIRVKSALRLSPKTDTEYFRIMADAASTTKFFDKFINHIQQQEVTEMALLAGAPDPKYNSITWGSWSHTTLAMRYGLDLPVYEFDPDLAEVAKHYFATRMAKNKMLADRAPTVEDFYKVYFNTTV